MGERDLRLRRDLRLERRDLLGEVGLATKADRLPRDLTQIEMRKLELARAMAAEPKPVHVPRERQPVVVIDEGPLVLVETRKDLSQFKLPFEQ